MVDLLITIILSGFAVTFAVELLALILWMFFNKETLYNFLTLPFSFGSLYLFYQLDKTFAVTVPATAFIALMLNKYINTKAVTSTRLNRL